MKKDIPFLPVKNVMVAVVKEMTDPTAKSDQQPETGKSQSKTKGLDWTVYFINSNKVAVENVLITSKGYGEKEGEKQATSTLRHFFPKVEAADYAKIEPIDPAIFHLFNEYWVSYYIDQQIFDKKFIFVPDAIREGNLQRINLLGKPGILHP